MLDKIQMDVSENDADFEFKFTAMTDFANLTLTKFNPTLIQLLQDYAQDKNLSRFQLTFTNAFNQMLTESYDASRLQKRGRFPNLKGSTKPGHRDFSSKQFRNSVSEKLTKYLFRNRKKDKPRKNGLPEGDASLMESLNQKPHGKSLDEKKLSEQGSSSVSKPFQDTRALPEGPPLLRTASDGFKVSDDSS
jgi:hypothetical protein